MVDHDLIIEPTVQLAERDHDVFAIGGAFLEPPIPRLDIRNRGPLDLNREIPVERGCRRNIRQGQTFSAEERTVGEHPVAPTMDTRAARPILPTPVHVMDIPWLAIPAIALRRTGRLEPGTMPSLLAEFPPKSDAVEREIVPAIQNALNALPFGTKARLKSLNDEKQRAGPDRVA